MSARNTQALPAQLKESLTKSQERKKAGRKAPAEPAPRLSGSFSARLPSSVLHHRETQLRDARWGRGSSWAQGASPGSLCGFWGTETTVPWRGGTHFGLVHLEGSGSGNEIPGEKARTESEPMFPHFPAVQRWTRSACLRALVFSFAKEESDHSLAGAERVASLTVALGRAAAPAPHLH